MLLLTPKHYELPVDSARGVGELPCSPDVPYCSTCRRVPPPAPALTFSTMPLSHVPGKVATREDYVDYEK